ncbi:MAG TPA: BrnT family toxin [Acetobacteraceae bacterium]|nr:BrnT family toxin [Acetobacteraceae bacterium]
MIPAVAGLHGSNRDKCQQHGVPIATIESLFHGPLAVFPDPEHSGTEERFKAIGRSDDGRSILIVFTLRRRTEGTLIRPISARYMHRKEIEHYEEEIARAEKRQGG